MTVRKERSSALDSGQISSFFKSTAGTGLTSRSSRARFAASALAGYDLTTANAAQRPGLAQALDHRFISKGVVAMGTFIFIVVVVLVIGFYMAAQAEKQKAAALAAYRAALASLKNDPGNSDLRQKTLNLGRIYSSLVRDKQGNTVFDEVALMNDINAACASTQHAVHTQAPASAAQQESHESRLRKLNDLFDQKLIDEQDYLRRKQEIINSI